MTPAEAIAVLQDLRGRSEADYRDAVEVLAGVVDDLRTCRTCGERKPPTEFFHSANVLAEEVERLREERDRWERIARNYESISANAGLL